MTFQKGHPGYKIKWTEGEIQHLREINLGEKNPAYGSKHDKKWKEDASKRHKGKKHALGYKHTEEFKEKKRESWIGSNNPNWGNFEIAYGKEKADKIKKQKSDSMIKYMQSHSEFTIGVTGKYEKQILDELQNKIGFSIKRHFYIVGYYLDGYCQELNLAIEVDEPEHYIKGELKEYDVVRQKEITEALNCKFLRIKESDYLKNKLQEVSIKCL